jgi:hypothetical protein
MAYRTFNAPIIELKMDGGEVETKAEGDLRRSPSEKAADLRRSAGHDELRRRLEALSGASGSAQVCAEWETRLRTSLAEELSE